MKNLKIILTATGCPGASTIIRYLKDYVKERKIEIIAVDMNKESIGRFLAPVFYTVPPATSPAYIESIKELIKKEKPDVFFCVSSNEVPVIAKHKKELEYLGTKVIVASEDAIETGGNKYKLYSKLKGIKEVNIPRFYNPKNLEEFIYYANELGYPEKRVCFKPHFSKGSRGYRVIDDSISRKDLLLKYKPDSTFISMEEFKNIFYHEKIFPQLMIMEYVEGEEIDAMSLALDGEALLITCKTRETSRAGVIMTGELVERPEIVKACKKIIEVIPIDYNSGMQFKGGKLIEINTRVSTFIYQDNLIEPYLSIKLALGEISKQEVKSYQNKIQYGRRMLRYMDQIFYNKD
jgi:carbamoyl-phosphate synthase large subunit